MSDIESNCSENISNRDELIATKQRKNDGATEQQIDNATEHRSVGKRPFEESQKPGSSFKRQRDKDAKHLQTKNDTSGNFRMSLPLTQISICRNSSKTKT